MRLQLTIAACLTFGAADTALRAQRPASETTFRVWNDAFNVALSRSDTATLRRLVADSLTFVIAVNGAVLSKPQLLDALARRGPSPALVTTDSVRAQRLGDGAVVVTLLRTERNRIGATEVPTTTRVVEVFARRGRRWALTHFAPVWRAADAPVVVLDTEALDRFVGRYELGPGYVDHVTRRGDYLDATVEGQTTGARLVPASPTTFRPDGGSTLIAFERDASGRVVGYVLALQDGRVLRARRVE